MQESSLYGAVDIGINSTLLTIAHRKASRFHPIYNAAEITRLGQDVDATGRLHSEAMQRTFDILQHYAAVCE